MSKRKCARCSSELESDEGYWCEGFKRDVCRNCYDEEVSACTLCGDEDVMPSDVSEFILCKAELSTTANLPPGIYRVTSRPFLLIPLIGSGSLLGGDVLFVDKLSQPDATYDISGHICQRCAKPYRRTFKQAYRMPKRFEPSLKKWQGCKTQEAKWFACMNHDRAGWEFKKAYVRKVILANPEMLRDLECDQIDSRDNRNLSYANANDWRDLQKAYDLPLLPTYHEWVLLKHRGVTVYRCYDDEREADSWLSLRPEPRYRNGAGHIFPETFHASSLPTYPHYDYEAPENKGKYHSHMDWARQHSRGAIIAAIEQGYLTQAGCFDAKGKELICR